MGKRGNDSYPWLALVLPEHIDAPFRIIPVTEPPSREKIRNRDDVLNRNSVFPVVVFLYVLRRHYDEIRIIEHEFDVFLGLVARKSLSSAVEKRDLVVMHGIVYLVYEPRPRSFADRLQEILEDIHVLVRDPSLDHYSGHSLVVSCVENWSLGIGVDDSGALLHAVGGHHLLHVTPEPSSGDVRAVRDVSECLFHV